MDVNVSHYYKPQPPVYKVFNVGSGNQAIKGVMDMNESRQPMGECRRSKEGLNLFFALRELTGPLPSAHYMFRTTT